MECLPQFGWKRWISKFLRAILTKFHASRVTKFARVLPIGIFVQLLVLYIGINLTLVIFVPLLHEFTLIITVLDTETNQPIQGAVLARGRLPLPDNSLIYRQTGRTTSDGKMILTQMLPDNTYWVWPTIGKYKNWSGRRMVVTASGYSPKEFVLPDMYTSAGQEIHVGMYTVTLTRDESSKSENATNRHEGSK